jgi:hypothetical protein
MKVTTRLLTSLALVGLLGALHAQVWHWHWGRESDDETHHANDRYYLTNNSGTHAVAMTEYDSSGTKRTWVSIIAESSHVNANPSDRNGRVFEFSDLALDNWHARGPSREEL